MHRFRGFVDLRANKSQQSTDSMLWPSFTDIMTVILMVFMLTMIVVIARNAHLIELIRLSQKRFETSEEQRQASDEAAAALRIRNTDLAEALRSNRMEIILLSDEVQRLEALVGSKLAVITRLEGEKEELLENLRLIRLQLARKDEEMGDVLAAGRQEREELEQQIAELLNMLSNKDAALVMLSDEKSDLEMTLARQRREFTSLEDKYLKLIRPARSSMGKQVASVHYFSVAGEPRYQFRGVAGGTLERVTLEELHSRLAALRDRLGPELYVKIVIPDNSGLSYNEAWRFTKEILSNYDYYYEEGW